MISEIKNNNIEIIITGDFCPKGNIEKLCLDEKYDAIYNDVLPFLRNSDLSITNLECPLTIISNPIIKSGPILSANPKCIEAIKYGGFSIVTLSNNHVLDQNEYGLMETIETCNQAGIKTVGAGRNLNEASKTLFIEIKSKKIAIINISENEFSAATSEKAGANPLNLIANYRQIKLAKENSDYLILLFHGGNEHYNLPSPGMVKLCHFFVEMGANAVLCHHTHCSSGYEIYKGAPIFYSLGNFLFDSKNSNSEHWNEGYLVKLNIINNSYSIYPYYQNKNQAGLRAIQGEEKNNFLNNLQQLSLIIQNEHLLNEKWKTFCRSKESYYMKTLLSINKFQRIFLRIRKSRTGIISKRNAVSIYNKINCESHREVLLEILRSKF